MKADSAEGRYATAAEEADAEHTFTAMCLYRDLAREAIALLRELEEWIICIEVGSINDGIACDKYLSKRRAFLDGGDK